MRETRKRGFVIKPEGLALIEKAMKEKGYNSREKLAEAANYLSIDTVNRLFRGNKTERKTIEAIAKALDLKPTDLVEQSEWYPASSTAAQEKTAADEINIDWQEVCHRMLKEQQDKQRLRRQATEMGFEVNVHVPLGLVERKQQQRRDGNVELSQLYQLEQEVIAKTYQPDEFLTEVIGQRQARKNKHIAIVGEPGAGKTTLLGAMASFIQSKTEDLPICITLASLQGKTLEHYLLKTWLSEAMGLVNPEVVVTPEIENELIKRFRKGGVWLLLDGVDEMGADSPIQALATIQKQLNDWLGQAQMVLTCRLNVWDASLNNILTGFDSYRTQEFTHEQIDRFIQQWFACAGKPQRGEQLQAKLKDTRRERICELVKHPLRLALLCQTSYLDKQGELPETKAALYGRFTRYFYEWKQSLHPTNLINRDELKDELHQALGKLAIAGLTSNARFRLIQSLARKEMGERLFKLACDLGWLNLVDRDAQSDEPVYAFFHPTFQEYFAALAIDDWDYFLPREHDNNSPKPVRDTYRIFEAQWKEVILLWLGREDVVYQEKEEFIKALVEFEDGWKQQFYRIQAYSLAAAGMAELKDCRQSDEIVGQLVKWYIKGNGEARKVLTGTEREKVIPAFVELIQVTQDEIILNKVADILGEIDPGNTTAISTLVKLIQTTQDKSIRRHAIESLGKIAPGNESAINTLVKLIQTIQKRFSLREALESLEKIALGNTTAINALVKLIQTTQDKSIRQRTIESLGKIAPGNESAINTLVKLIQTTQDEFILRKALKSLEKIALGNATAINALDKLIKTTQDEFIRRHAIVSWAKINPDNERARRIIRQSLPREDNVSELTFYARWNLFPTPQHELNFLVCARKGKETKISFLFQLDQTTQDEEIGKYAVERLGNNYPGNETAIALLSKVVQSFLDLTLAEQRLKGYELPPKLTRDEQQKLENLRKRFDTAHTEFLYSEETWKFGQILKADQLRKIVTTFKNYVTQEVDENDFSQERLEDILWDCAQNLAYPDFYRACHTEPFPVQALEDQFTDIASQLQPTDKTYPIVINAQALEGETDTSAIAQALSNRIYRFVFPDDSEIPPEVSNAYQLERSLLQLKKQLQKQNLALILDKCEPNQSQVTFCRKLTDVLHIAWITNQPLEPPLKGFPFEQANLLSAIQSWIDEIG